MEEKKMAELLDRIDAILWPAGDPDAPWTSGTAADIAEVMKMYDVAPKASHEMTQREMISLEARRHDLKPGEALLISVDVEDEMETMAFDVGDDLVEAASEAWTEIGLPGTLVLVLPATEARTAKMVEQALLDLESLRRRGIMLEEIATLVPGRRSVIAPLARSSNDGSPE